MGNKNRFVVIEGLDGSGKSTQLRLLTTYFKKNNISYKYLHFPRTDEGIFGDLVARFTRGDLGKINEVNPYLVSLIYAGDRNEAGKTISKWIDEGSFVLVDRYVHSNIAFQCAKLEKDEERLDLKNWIIELEYKYYGLPEPDLNVFLDVPFQFTKTQLHSGREGEDRNYLHGKKDIHEADLEFQKKVRDVYLSFEDDKNFKILPCYDGKGTMLQPEVIFSKLIKILI